MSGWQSALALGIGGAGSILGGNAQKKAAKYATDVQTNFTLGAYNTANDLARKTNRAMQPIVEHGDVAFDELTGTWAYNDPGSYETSPLAYQSAGYDSPGVYETSDFDFNYEESPGYQYRLQEGLDALAANNAARGLRFSGSAGQDAMRHAIGMAEQDYQSDFNRYLSQRQDTRADHNTALNSFTALNADNRAEHAAERAGYGQWAGLQQNYASNLAGLVDRGDAARRSILNAEQAKANALLGAGSDLADVAGQGALRNADATNATYNNLASLAGMWAGGYFDRPTPTANGYGFRNNGGLPVPA